MERLWMMATVHCFWFYLGSFCDRIISVNAISLSCRHINICVLSLFLTMNKVQFVGCPYHGCALHTHCR